MINLAMLRSKSAGVLVRDRYLSGIVHDLAENGIEYERLMISRHAAADAGRPHRKEIDTFAGFTGLFESHGRLLARNRYEVHSLGKVLEGNGDTRASVRILAEIHLAADGTWKTVAWKEQANDP